MIDQDEVDGWREIWSRFRQSFVRSVQGHSAQISLLVSRKLVLDLVGYRRDHDSLIIT